MSAIAGDSSDGQVEVIKVLFALYPGYNTLDVAGPLEILNRSLHDNKDKSTSLFSDSLAIPCIIELHWHVLCIRAFVDTSPQRARPSNASSLVLRRP